MERATYETPDVTKKALHKGDLQLISMQFGISMFLKDLIGITIYHTYVLCSIYHITLIILVTLYFKVQFIYI